MYSSPLIQVQFDYGSKNANKSYVNELGAASYLVMIQSSNCIISDRYENISLHWIVCVCVIHARNLCKESLAVL